MKVTSLLVVVLLSACLSDRVLGHHSGAEFARDTLVELEGEVVRVLWRNPHILLTIESRNQDGVIEEWKLEGWPAYGLINAGVPRDIVSVGDTVQIVGRPSSRRDWFMHVNSLLLTDGTELLLGTNDTHWSTGRVLSRSTEAFTEEQVLASQEHAQGIFRVWSRSPSGGQVRWEGQLPLTDAAISAQQDWDAEVGDDVRRCVPPGMPRAMTQSPHPLEFADAGDRIIITMQEFNESRTIHMSLQVPSDPRTYSRLGYSVGRWEGQSLIVDTANIDYPLFSRDGIPQSTGVRIRESFKLCYVESQLSYRIELIDPATFTESIVGT
jgi:hypothetical protein